MRNHEKLVAILEELRPFLQDECEYFGVYDDARHRLCEVMWGEQEESSGLSDPTVACSTTGPGSEALL